MAPISKDLWKEILFNQGLPLIGSNKPDEGNGFHDRVSWDMNFHENPYRPQKMLDNVKLNHYLDSIGGMINMIIDNHEEFKDGIKIENCSENYLATVKMYLDNYNYRGRNIFFNEITEWSRHFCRYGRIIFEIVGWYTNDSSQFYGYELKMLNNEYCKIKRKSIIYNAPFSKKKDKIIYKKERIPLNKCIIVDFPKELGGYKQFENKISKVNNLGSQFMSIDDPGKNLAHLKNWDKEFEKIICDWGSITQYEGVTDYYQVLLKLKFTKTVILCLNELINCFEQLIVYLNFKLKEKAKVEVDLNKYTLKNYVSIEEKWKKGELSFKEASDFYLN
ncbi:hypothetical protein [uncultured Lutibacter sp.]|uniref:hypothetical protein n=1 Tax=uncultured Lutibacter sp. TaxID=437739 RepID=UPI00261CFC40|nr:hypothetical protein [uncultured Lutibacter sp.]